VKFEEPARDSGLRPGLTDDCSWEGRREPGVAPIKSLTMFSTEMVAGSSARRGSTVSGLAEPRFGDADSGPFVGVFALT
jgi:hypothetical protein